MIVTQAGATDGLAAGESHSAKGTVETGQYDGGNCPDDNIADESGTKNRGPVGENLLPPEKESVILQEGVDQTTDRSRPAYHKKEGPD